MLIFVSWFTGGPIWEATSKSNKNKPLRNSETRPQRFNSFWSHWFSTRRVAAQDTRQQGRTNPHGIPSFCACTSRLWKKMGSKNHGSGKWKWLYLNGPFFSLPNGRKGIRKSQSTKNNGCWVNSFCWIPTNEMNWKCAGSINNGTTVSVLSKPIPSMGLVFLPTFTIQIDQNVGKYAIHGW